MNRFMLFCLVAAAFLCSCATTDKKPEIKVETQIVEVPVKVARTPPAELLAPVKTAPLPVFVSPINPKATSALTAEGEKRLKILLNELATKIEAWKAWATSPDAVE